MLAAGLACLLLRTARLTQDPVRAGFFADVGTRGSPVCCVRKGWVVGFLRWPSCARPVPIGW